MGFQQLGYILTVESVYTWPAEMFRSRPWSAEFWSLRKSCGSFV